MVNNILNFLRNNPHMIPEGYHAIHEVVNGIVDEIKKPKELKEMEALFQRHPLTDQELEAILASIHRANASSTPQENPAPKPG